MTDENNSSNGENNLKSGKEANSNSSSNKWKYLSFALMGLLATGGIVSFTPQASAHITNQTQHMLEHIYAFVDGIEAKTNNLPADPASNTVVNTRASQASVDTLTTGATKIDAKVTDIQSKVDAAVSSRASQTSINAIQTDVDALQTAVSAIPTNGSGRAICITIDIDNDGWVKHDEISPRPHSGVNYANCDLFGVQFSGSTLRNANFSGADLSRSGFLAGTALDNANFSGADLSLSRLTDSEAPNANFSGAILTGADFTGLYIAGADFTGCIGDPIGTPIGGSLPDCA